MADDGAPAGEQLAPLRGAFGSRRDPVALAASALDVTARLPAHAAGDAPAALAGPLKAARKEQTIVFAGGSGLCKSGVLNDICCASKVPAAEYAAAAAAAAAEIGASTTNAVEIFTPSKLDPWAPHAPRLQPAEVTPDSEVEVYIPLDCIWVPGRVLAVRQRGETTEVRVDEYAPLYDAEGAPSYDASGAPLYGNELTGDKEADQWRSLTCCDDDAPAGLGDGVALRHVRCRGDARDAGAPGGVVPAPEAELARYDGVLPEGCVGHTTEVPEQVLIGGKLYGAALYFTPFAPVAAACAKLRAALLEREAAPPARRNDLNAALAAMQAAGSDGAGAAPPAQDDDDAAPPAPDDDDAGGSEDAPPPTVLTKREMELARAALGLPPGFNLASLKPRDVPAELPREVAALLGRACRFTPLGDAAGGDVQAAHKHALKGFLASHTRAVWQYPQDAAAPGRRPRLQWGNAFIGLIDRVVITLPCSALAAGRVLVDTRGAEHPPAAALAAANDASASATAASLASAGAAVLMVGARADASAVLAAARSGGIIHELATSALQAYAARAAGQPPPPRGVRVALVIAADKHWRDDALAALRQGNRAAPPGSLALARLRGMEATAFAAHKATLRDEIKTTLLRFASQFLDDAAADECAAQALRDISFIALYPRVALGHAAPPRIEPPASAADAAALADTGGLLRLAQFITGGGSPGPAARTAASAAARALRRGLAALGHELALHKEDPAALARLRAHAWAVAPDPDTIVVLRSTAGSSAVAGPLDLSAWKDKLVAQLRTEVGEMGETLAAGCTKSEFGRVLAALVGHPFAPGEDAEPPSEFSGARAAAAKGPLSALITCGELSGTQLYELLIGPAVHWEDGLTPDTAAGQPALPPALALGWLRGAASLAAPAPCAEAQVWATLLGALGRLFEEATREAADLEDADAEEVARLRALLAAREAEFRVSVMQLIDRFASLNDAMWWRGPEAAARAAGATATAALLERVRKGKQALIVPVSTVKSIKGTKLGSIESAVPRVAAAGASAFCDAALSSLSDMVSAFVADVRELVQRHCDELAHVSHGALRQLTRPRLWAALDTHVAATELAARLERVADAATPSKAEQMLPERMLPRALVMALYGKLRGMLPTGATLATALDMPPQAHAAAMLAAAAEAAQASSAADAAAASALLARWRAAGEEPARRAAWCAATLRTLQHAFGEHASLRDCEPLRQFLCAASSSSSTSSSWDDDSAHNDAATKHEEWSDEQTYALLGLCADAAALAGTAAFPLIKPAPTPLTRLEHDWLVHLTRLLNNQRPAASSGDAVAGDAAATAGLRGSADATPARAPKPLAARSAPQDWVGVPVRKLFDDPDDGNRPKWFDGAVQRVIEGNPVWYHVRYSDGDVEDLTLTQLQAAAAAAERASPRIAAAAASPGTPAQLGGAWPQRSVAAVRRHVATLQLSAGGGPDALAALRARFAPDRQLLLHKADGWVVAHAVTKRGGRGDAQYLYYGDIGADGKPTGMPPGRDIATAAPTRVFGGRGALLEIHHFRNGTVFALPGGGGGGGFGPRLASEEEQRLRDAMTPRSVVRDGAACPAEAVAEHRSEHRLGTWRWEYVTRADGATAGQVDRYYHAPDGARMRSFAEVQRYLASRSGRLLDDEDDDDDDDDDDGGAPAAPRRGAKKRSAAASAADDAGPSRQQAKRAAKDKAAPGFYAGQDGDDGDDAALRHA